MRLNRSDDPYLEKMRDSLSVPDRNGSTRLKIVGSAIVLAIVLLVAGIQQWGNRATDSAPGSVETAQSPGPPVSRSETERTVFGDRPSRVDDDLSKELENLSRSTVDREAPARGGRYQRSRTVAPDGSEGVARSGGNTAVPSDLQSFLDRWRTTLIAGDADAQASLYARNVDRFFTKRNVSRAEVRREKQRMLTKYPEFHKYEVSDVRVESMDNDRAVITFRKDWDARGRGRFAGSEQQRLTLRKESGAWRITSEEETKVHWVRRS